MNSSNLNRKLHKVGEWVLVFVCLVGCLFFFFLSQSE